ncbi:MAG: hypothetical protein LQ352_008160, partial [Teloschistes flavicans]
MSSKKGEIQEDAVDATINELPARTRAKTKEVRQNAIEAGIVAPAESSAMGAASGPESDVFEEEDRLQDFGGTGVDNAAWNDWEKANDDFLRLIQTKPRPQYAGVRPFLVDISFSMDDPEDKESPRTFFVQGQHWLDFDTMVTNLMAWAKGFEMGFLKVRVPIEGFTPITGKFRRGDVQLKTHRIQLKPLPVHKSFDNRGVYRIIYSQKADDVSSDVWRAIMKDYELETIAHEKEKGITAKQDIQNEPQASSTPAPGDSSGKDGSSASVTPAKTTKPAPRSTDQPKGTKPRPKRTPKSIAQRKPKPETPTPTK